MSKMSERLTPSEVAKLDPFGVRGGSASKELAGLLGPEQTLSPDWAEELIEREKQSLKEFFGQKIQVLPLPEEITPEKLAHWTSLEMRLHYLPLIPMFQSLLNFPGWKIKPGERFYQLIEEGKLAAEALKLPGKWVLVDNRDKPNFQEGKQIYPQDFLGPVMEKLRESSHQLYQWKVPRSRSFISWQDYQKILRPEIAIILRVKVKQVRLPRLVEFNFLGNAYYPQWGTTNTSEWMEDSYYQNQKKVALRNGDSAFGGLAEVDDGFGISRQQSYIQFRPLVEF